MGSNRVLLVLSKAVTHSGLLGQEVLLCAVAWRLARFQIKRTSASTFNNLVTVYQSPLSASHAVKHTCLLSPLSFTLMSPLFLSLFLLFQSLVDGVVLYLLKGKWLTVLIVAIMSPASFP